ncbi:MAG: hypothetical protein LH606_02085 [Cytophagaceae bacterium]|nr:hypothetical protein [Cytophagaceae bacterium]
MKLFWLFPLLFFAGVQRHDFHTSLTEMRLNPKQKTIEVSIRVFTDDFEKALTKANTGQPVKLEAKDRHDALVDRYLKQHFTLTLANGQRRIHQYLGKEFEVDATWIYLEIPFHESLIGTKLQNDVFFDLFDDQTNLVNVIYPNDRKSFLFNQKNKVQQL